MIERLTAESGDPVVRVDGRLLASRVDPRAEAKAWAEQRRAFLTRVEAVIVLGLGAGHHVAELLGRTSARILVIEPRADVIDALALALDPDRVSVLNLASLADVRASEAVRRAVTGAYLTLVHPASRALDPEFYNATVTQLNGRDWGSLSWIWALRGHGALDVAPTDRALTIHDLAQSELVTDANEREKLLVDALRRLVK